MKEYTIDGTQTSDIPFKQWVNYKINNTKWFLVLLFWIVFIIVPCYITMIKWLKNWKEDNEMTHDNKQIRNDIFKTQLKPDFCFFLSCSIKSNYLNSWFHLRHHFYCPASRTLLPLWLGRLLLLQGLRQWQCSGTLHTSLLQCSVPLWRRRHYQQLPVRRRDRLKNCLPQRFSSSVDKK